MRPRQVVGALERRELSVLERAWRALVRVGLEVFVDGRIGGGDLRLLALQLPGIEVNRGLGLTSANAEQFIRKLPN